VPDIRPAFATRQRIRPGPRGQRVSRQVGPTVRILSSAEIESSKFLNSSNSIGSLIISGILRHPVASGLAATAQKP
jgi:hypothetical protein